MNSAYLDLLVHPVSKEKLQYNERDNYLSTGTNEEQFQVVRGVPVLLSYDTQKEGHFNYQEHYERDAETYDYFADWEEGQQEESRRLRQHILKEIPNQAGWILDIGCGGGWLAKTLCKQGHRVISTDISTKNPIKAVEMIPEPTHFGLVADVFLLPVKENSIDCVVSSEVIEHVPDPMAFIAALYKVLAPGGKLVITTPYNEKIQQSLCIHCNQLTPQNAHLHSFTRQKIEALVPSDAVGIKTSIFNSKALVMLRLHLLLRFLPYSLWNIFDKIMLQLSRKKALRLMLVLYKK